MENKWKPSTRWRGRAPGGFVKMTTSSPELPANVAAAMKAAEADIVSGKLKPFAGPIKDQNGAQKVAAGAVLTDEQLKGINWLVEGVQGKLPSAS